MNIHECESSPFAMLLCCYTYFIEKNLAIPLRPGLYSLDLENSDLDSSSIVPVRWIVLVPPAFTPMFAQQLGGCLMRLTRFACVSNMLSLKQTSMFFVFSGPQFLVMIRAHGTTCRVHLARPIHCEHCRTSWKPT